MASDLCRELEALRVGLDRAAAQAAFADFLDDKRYSRNQIQFVTLIINGAVGSNYVDLVVVLLVAAIFQVGMYEYDNSYVFMPLEAAQLYFQLEGRANELEIMVEAPGPNRDSRIISPPTQRSRLALVELNASPVTPATSQSLAITVLST